MLSLDNIEVRNLFFCLLFVNALPLVAREITWHEGTVVLRTREVITGQISLEPAYDLAVVRAGDSCLVLPAFKVESLYFYDASADINRRFVTLSNNKQPVARFSFYEVVLAGSVSVVRHVRPFTSGSESDRLDFDYYIVWNGALTRLAKFGRKVYPSLSRSAGDRLSHFVSANHLHLYSDAHAIRIIKFYNQLPESARLLAMH